MPVVKILFLKSEDIPAIKDISDACFGSNYLKASQIREMFANEGVCCKIIFDNEVIGFCLTTITKSNLGSLGFAGRENESGKVGLIKTLAISPIYQRKGFGTQLLKHVISKLQTKKEVEAIYYPSWVESDSEGFTKMVKTEGFIQYKRYDNFWLNESVSNMYQCAKCGNPPCHCTMLLYRKELFLNNT